jgi:hypothetical protein
MGTEARYTRNGAGARGHVETRAHGLEIEPFIGHRAPLPPSVASQAYHRIGYAAKRDPCASFRRGAKTGRATDRTDGGQHDGSGRARGTGPDKARIARQFIEAIPFSKALGMRLDEIGDGVAVISMPYDPALVGDPQSGVIHGGAVSALMDTCGGAAVMCHPEALPPRRRSTSGSTTCGPRRRATGSRHAPIAIT